MEAGLTSQPDPLARELAAEQAHVDAVYARLDAATRSAEQVAQQGRDLFRTERTNFVREEDGTGMFERDVFAFQAAKRLATLESEHEGLVFGRLDRTDGEALHIGRIGVRDDEYEPLVIDWRARAAEPFYRATPNEPMQVVRRRVLRCRGQKVIGIEDDLLDGDSDADLVVIGEGALMAALKRARGPQMRDIVATIQSEQDEAIRAPHQGFTIISGGPGTGKTVVALHRAAFLLYTHRRRFENGGVLVVGPSRVFLTYIERVLPSLGEDSVTLHDLGSVASDVLGRSAERVDDSRTHGIKGSSRMVGILRRLVDLPLDPTAPTGVLGETGPGVLRVSVKGEVLTAGLETTHRIRSRVLKQTKLNLGRQPAASAMLDHLWSIFSNDAGITRDEFEDFVTSSASWRMFLQAWWPTLSPEQVLRRLADPDVVAQVATGMHPDDRDALAASYRDHTDFTVDDMALLDELAQIIGPVPEDPEEDPSLFLEEGAGVDELVTITDRLRDERAEDPAEDRHRRFAHVLVDEAQDLSPMQWRMLRRRGGQASWTIVGDPAQSSWPDATETQRVLDDLMGTAPRRQHRMSTNYRSPAEVFELAAQVVTKVAPDADLPDAVRRTGHAPRLTTTTPKDLARHVEGLIADMLAAVEGTIGVITPTAHLDLRDRVTMTDPRVIWVTPLQSKGLEYDAVVVVDPDAIVEESPGRERVLYVALTRPTQLLATVDLTTNPAWRESLEWRATDSA